MKKEIKEKFSKNKDNMEFYDQDVNASDEDQQNQQQDKPVRRRYNNRRYQKTKIKPIHFVYECEGENSFFDILDIMINDCPLINNFLSQIDSEIESFDDYVAKVSNLIVMTPPQLLAKKNIHTCYSVSANRVHIRLEGGVAFTIEVRYVIREGKAIIESCTGTIIMYSNNDTLYNTLIEDDWHLVER